MTYEEAVNFNQNWTAEQAKNDLERYLLRGENPACKAVALGMQALEKQIPKKPIPQKDKIMGHIVSFTCPNCGGEDLGNNEYRFECCENCGQALDWGDMNDR